MATLPSTRSRVRREDARALSVAIPAASSRPGFCCNPTRIDYSILKMTVGTTGRLARTSMCKAELVVT